MDKSGSIKRFFESNSKHLRKAVDVICSCLTKEELETLAILSDKDNMSFKDQLLTMTLGKTIPYSLDKVEIITRSIVDILRTDFENTNGDNKFLRKNFMDLLDATLFESR